MAIAFDASAIGANTTATSLTWSHTCAGSDRLILVGLMSNGTVTGVTYNGVGLTLIGSVVFTPNAAYSNYLYDLVAPAAGANNVVVSLSGSAVVCGVSVSYTGAQQSGQPDANGTNNGTVTTNYAQVITPVADNCWIVELAENNNGPPSAVSGCVLRQAASGQNFGLFDTNAAISPAAATTLTVTVGVSATWDSVIASIAPAPASTATGNMFLVM